MKNPNGAGSVVNLGKNRRKPFAPRVTVGFDKKTGKQIFKYLGYFKTKKEAMNCLAEYNLNPYDINLRNISFQEVFEKFLIFGFGKIIKIADRYRKRQIGVDWLPIGDG